MFKKQDKPFFHTFTVRSATPFLTKSQVEPKKVQQYHKKYKKSDNGAESNIKIFFLPFIGLEFFQHYIIDVFHPLISNFNAVVSKVRPRHISKK